MTVRAVLSSAFLNSVGAPDIQHFAAQHPARRFVPVLHGHTVHEQPVQATILQDQLDAFGADKLAQGVVDRLGRQLRIVPRQGVAQAAFEEDLPIARPLGVWLTRGDLSAVDDLPGNAFQPGERRLLDDGFRDGWASS
ncbi:MAG: hypothetical protein H0W48_15760 [Methylibium sp.]|nr:hypothetical protein [Methylibium sp.]